MKLISPLRSRKGFTLLEILVALTLVSVVLVVVLQLFSANLRSLSVSQSYEDAAAHAEAIMRNVLEDEDFPQKSYTGTTEDGYRYEVAITKAYDERTRELNVELYEVTLNVFWNDRVRERSMTLTTLKMTEKKI